MTLHCSNQLHINQFQPSGGETVSYNIKCLMPFVVVFN